MAAKLRSVTVMNDGSEIDLHVKFVVNSVMHLIQQATDIIIVAKAWSQKKTWAIKLELQ